MTAKWEFYGSQWSLKLGLGAKVSLWTRAQSNLQFYHLMEPSCGYVRYCNIHYNTHTHTYTHRPLFIQRYLCNPLRLSILLEVNCTHFKVGEPETESNKAIYLASHMKSKMGTEPKILDFSLWSKWSILGCVFFTLCHTG